jgi:sigma-B regulation protein RsbU (phosphoserine phosphatase)
MRSLLNLDQIGRGIMNTALGTMFIDHGYVLLLDRDGNTYDCLVEAGRAETTTAGEGAQPSTETTMTCGPEVAELKLAAQEPLIQMMAEAGRGVTVYDIDEDPAFEVSREACRQTFERMQAQLLVPLIYENRLTGLIALGRKKSGKFYRREDIQLLNVLANQGALAFQNARMVEEVIEKERMEEELSIARDLQVSMLPAECPLVAGFDVSAYSLPAREVGGDFYDFFEIGGDRLGMVIGDVTGKSVSGALVMSASRSVFRMLSEEDLSVAESMMRANRRLKKDVKSGMFVALLYAVLGGRGKTITLCSAGQTQPVFRKASTGSAELIQTQGDTFPLGILDEAEYEETVVALSPGEVVVLYTDGIVEAMNPAGELFGFDRLLESVSVSDGGTAEALLNEILGRLNAFVAGAPAHDDITLIVVRAE